MNQDDRRAKAQLATMAERAAVWADRRGSPGGFVVGAGSAMAGDDRGSEPFLVSHAIRASLGTAIDHLHALYALVLHSGFLHLHAPASVTRGALECASTAIWLAEPSSREERIRRALCWAGKDIKDGDKAAIGAGYPVNPRLRNASTS
ncbi:hypothetical protein [Amycolatopsis sp. NPDC051071]|uniref:hypothetical protein n=1 Tax=Amycolatopsis sp. NPDC051071 TaxID=3154637 RepID=UPI00341798B0